MRATESSRNESNHRDGKLNRKVEKVAALVVIIKILLQ